MCSPGALGVAQEAASASESSTHPAAKSSNPATTHTRKTKASSRRSKRKAVRGQQKIDPERAEQIQKALIREHYLSGPAAGAWNQASEDAMRRYQADHGWQSKTVPDSRALISLGLGPSHDHLLNPDSAMTGPAPARNSSSTSASVHPLTPPVPAAKTQPDPAAGSPSNSSDQSRPQ